MDGMRHIESDMLTLKEKKLDSSMQHQQTSLHLKISGLIQKNLAVLG